MEYYKGMRMRLPYNGSHWLGVGVRSISEQDAEGLTWPFDMEVHEAVFGLNVDGCPRPYVLLIVFFKEFWDLLTDEVKGVVVEFADGNCGFDRIN